MANGSARPTAENFSLQFREETQEEREKQEGRGERDEVGGETVKHRDLGKVRKREFAVICRGDVQSR